MRRKTKKRRNTKLMVEATTMDTTLRHAAPDQRREGRVVYQGSVGFLVKRCILVLDRRPSGLQAASILAFSRSNPALP